MITNVGSSHLEHLGTRENIVGYIAEIEPLLFEFLQLLVVWVGHRLCTLLKGLYSVIYLARNHAVAHLLEVADNIYLLLGYEKFAGRHRSADMLLPSYKCVEIITFGRNVNLEFAVDKRNYRSERFYALSRLEQIIANQNDSLCLVADDLAFDASWACYFGLLQT